MNVHANKEGMLIIISTDQYKSIQLFLMGTDVILFMRLLLVQQLILFIIFMITIRESYKRRNWKSPN